MIERPSSTRIFHGWWIVGVSIIGQSFGLASLLVYTFGVFAKPLAAEFKTNRASIALAVSLIDITLAFTAPGAGRLVDRYGARGVIVTSLLALQAAVAALAFVHPPLWHFYALYVFAGLVGVATTPVTYSRVVANWFDRKRGLALGIANTGVGLGVFITPSLAQFLIDKIGWRYAFAGLAGVSLVVAVPVVALFLTASPEEMGLTPDGSPPHQSLTAGPANLGRTVMQALRSLNFWQLCAIFFCVGAVGNGAIAHLAPLLTDRGVTAQQAAFATSLFGIATIAGRVINGYLVDRFFAPRVAAILFAGAAGGAVLLWIGAAGSAALVASALLGLAIGAEADVMPFLISRYFGMRSMAELYGCVFGAYTLGNATGRYLMAVGFDTTGSYQIPLACACVVLAVAVIATLLLPKYPRFSAAP